MDEIRVVLEQLNNNIMKQALEINNLKLEHVKLMSEAKVERSDRLMTAMEVKKEKFGGIGDDKFKKILQDPTFPRIILYKGAHILFSDKAIDKWFAEKQTYIKF